VPQHLCCPAHSHCQHHRYFGMPPPLTLRKGDRVTRFFRFSKPNLVRKTMCETIEKNCLIKCIFFCFMNQTNILWGPCFL
jgi:hypothetical protein